MLNFTTSKLWVVGDTHGIVQDIAWIDQKAKEEEVELIIQVGDFGVRWDHHCDRYFQQKKQGGPTWITVGGNHENYVCWQKLQADQNFPVLIELWSNVYWAPRPTLMKINEEKFLLMGGANSIDRHLRIEGKNWWSYEQPTREEMDNFFSLLEDERPEIVVTHEAPASVNLGENNRENKVAIDFDNVITHSNHMPRKWYYGHHHHSGTTEVGKTNFVCCGMGKHYVIHQQGEDDGQNH